MRRTTVGLGAGVLAAALVGAGCNAGTAPKAAARPCRSSSARSSAAASRLWAWC